MRANDKPTHAVPPSIAAVIAAEGGQVTFARFMELALTDPVSGYYATRAGPLGRHGDFVTAPHRSPSFNRALGRLIGSLLASVQEAVSLDGEGNPSEPAGPLLPMAVTEVGPGEGDLAAGILAEWDRERPELQAVVRYQLVEVSQALRERQWDRLLAARQAGWDLRWVERLEELEPAPGLILSNELVDALPVHVIRVSDGALSEAHVCLISSVDDASAAIFAGAGPQSWLAEEVWLAPSRDALEELALLFGTTDPARLRPLSRDGYLELRPAARVFLQSAARLLTPGCLVTVDYGDWLTGPPANGGAGDAAGPGEDTLQARPTLHGRTLRTYFHHERGSDPFRHIGNQDLTADVDFRALDLHGRAFGLDTTLYAPLSTVLAGTGAQQDLDELKEEAQRSMEADAQAALLQALLDEEDLGGLFKLLLQVKES